MDPFSSLPNEILSDIVTLLPDLHTLRSLLAASPVISHLFNYKGAQITEAIMSRSLPPQIVVPMRMVAMIASSNSLKATTLEDFTKTYIFPARIASPWCAPLTLTAPQPSVLRWILTLHCQIRHLTYCCLHELMRRCLETKPSHLLDRTYGYRKSRFSPIIPPLSRFIPQGQPYQPQDAGPPSWIEEQRVCRAFWHVQLFLDLRDAAVARGASLGWSSQDILRIRQSTASSYWEPLYASQYDEIETVLDFVQDYNLPTTADSSLGRSLDKLPWTTSELQIFWPTLEPADTYTWGQSADYLETASQGVHYGRAALVNTPGTPLQYVDFAIFRRLGFAIWDLKRMVALGFTSPPLPPGTLSYNPTEEPYLSIYNKMFTWRSLLTEEQLAAHENVRLANLRR